MFGSLRKKLQEGVAKLSGKPEAPESNESPAPRKPAPEPISSKKSGKSQPRMEKPVQENVPGPLKPRIAEEESSQTETRQGRLSRLRERVATREVTAKDIDDFFEESEIALLQSDVAVEVMDSLKEKLKSRLVESKVGRGRTSEEVSSAFRDSLLEIVDQGRIDLPEKAAEARKTGKPLTMIFLGFNGAGKTTTIAKTASFLKKNGFSVALAAGDTFRAASIEQLEVHGQRLGVKVIKHNYGSDSAAVIFDARKYAEKAGVNVVLADTAGRAHTDRNLMDELKKVIRVNQPDLKVLVVDSLTGNDAVEQARKFHEAVGVDCVVMTKTDVNPRGGSILSVAHTIGKPILFLGTGQEYEKVEMFDPRKFVDELIGP